jgi:hypothetical protein
VRQGLRVHAALCVWVLQHCQDPAVDLSVIRQALRPDGALFVVNNTFHAAPTEERPFVNDGRDVRAILGGQFLEVAAGAFSEETVGPVLAPCSYWTVQRLPPAG